MHNFKLFYSLIKPVFETLSGQVLFRFDHNFQNVLEFVGKKSIEQINITLDCNGTVSVTLDLFQGLRVSNTRF